MSLARPHVDTLDPRRLLAVDISIEQITTARFPSDEILPKLAITVLYHNNTSASFSQIGSGNAAGTIVFSRDSVLGNADDVAGTGNLVAPSMAGFSSASASDSIWVFGLAPGAYYVGSHFTSLDRSTGESRSQDFITPLPTFLVLGTALGSDTLLGTADGDTITLERADGRRVVTVNGEPHPYDRAGPLFIDAGSGNDRVIASADFDIELLVTGSGGNDTIVGGAADDGISGANGKDKIWGGAGNDDLYGGANKDYLNGQAGDDTLGGGGGNDVLEDTLGRDYLLGGTGNDHFDTFDGDGFDTVSGAAGDDAALLDASDTRSKIETLLS
ncbi:MAG: calcium-binding protein [Tepidisphaeraceae bacterium]